MLYGWLHLRAAAFSSYLELACLKLSFAIISSTHIDIKAALFLHDLLRSFWRVALLFLLLLLLLSDEFFRYASQFEILIGVIFLASVGIGFATSLKSLN